MNCAVEGCEKPVGTRGWCHAHYKRVQLYGDPLAGGPPHASPGEPAKFLQSAVVVESDECVLWPYAKNKEGYGKLFVEKKLTLAHRIVCEAWHGSPPFEKAEAAHLCGNGHLGCINGRHLAWKDRKGNVADMVAHGRSQRGEKMHAAKLTEEAVRFIWDHAEMTNGELARMFGVVQSNIIAIRKGRSWRWFTKTLGPQKGTPVGRVASLEEDAA